MDVFTAPEQTDGGGGLQRIRRILLEKALQAARRHCARTASCGASLAAVAS